MLNNNSDPNVTVALQYAKEMEQIMSYFHKNSYKVGPVQGIMLSNRLLQLSGRIVVTLEAALAGTSGNGE